MWRGHNALEFQLYKALFLLIYIVDCRFTLNTAYKNDVIDTVGICY